MNNSRKIITRVNIRPDRDVSWAAIGRQLYTSPLKIKGCGYFVHISVEITQVSDSNSPRYRRSYWLKAAKETTIFPKVNFIGVVRHCFAGKLAKGSEPLCFLEGFYMSYRSRMGGGEPTPTALSISVSGVKPREIQKKSYGRVSKITG